MALDTNHLHKHLPLNRMHHGDARELAAMLPDRTIAVTLTSPPYWGLKDYGAPGQVGRNQSYDEYMKDLIAIFCHVHRATRDNGSLWIVLDTLKIAGRLKLLPFELAQRLQNEAGWILQDVIIWDKGKTLPWSRPGQLRNQFEYLFCFSKTNSFKYKVDRLKEIELKEWWVRYPERYNPKGKVPSNIWNIPIPIQGSWGSNGLRHACPFPIELVERVLLLTTDPGNNDIVFDPFAGSGTVLALAEQMGRMFLGFEVNPKFIEMFRKTVRDLVKKEWTSRSKHLETLEGKRRYLQDQILRLRLLKYPRALLKQLVTHYHLNQSTVCSVLALTDTVPPVVKKQSNRHHILSLKVFLICKDRQPVKTIEAAIVESTSKPPLSKFGINAQITVLTIQDIRNLQPKFHLADSTSIWLYKNGVTNKYSGQTTFQRWLDNLPLTADGSVSTQLFPPIASNVPVLQEIVRTWFPKNSPGPLKQQESLFPS